MSASVPTRPLRPAQMVSTGVQKKGIQILLTTSTALGGVALAFYYPYAVRNASYLSLIAAAVLLTCAGTLAALQNMEIRRRASLFLTTVFLLDVLLLCTTGLSTFTLVILFTVLFYCAHYLGVRRMGLMLGAWAACVAVYWLQVEYWPVLPAPVAPTGILYQVVAVSLMVHTAGGVLVTHLILVREYEQTTVNVINATDARESEQRKIEKRLEERSLYLQRRLLQARAAAEISGSITSILDPQQLLQTVVELMIDRFKLYYMGVFVMDDDKKTVVLRAGSGEAGAAMVAARHSLAVGGSSMIGWATLNRQARIALDVGADAIRFNNPYLPHTRSELALPILSKGEVLGALSIQSTQPNAFDEDDITILQGIADSLGAALENARLYQQAEAALEEVRSATRDYINDTWAQTAREYGKLEYAYENPNALSGDLGGVHEFPIVLRDQVIGVISLESDSAQLSADELAFAEAVTQQTAVALENARLLEETQRHAREEEKLNELSEQFSQARTIDEILQSAVMGLGELPSVAEVTIHLTPPEAEMLPSGGNGNANHG